MEVNRVSVARSMAKCGIAVIECLSAVFRSVAILLESCARMIREYSEETEQVPQQREIVAELG